jgi:hypothetical protein
LRLLVLLFILGLCTACANKTNNYEKVIVDPSLNDSLFFTKKYTLNPNTVKTKYGYDGVEDSTLYLVKTTLLVDNNPYERIRFTDTEKLGDTLLINIYEDNPSSSHQLKVKIINGQFNASYSNLIPIYKEPIILEIQEKKLVLKHFPGEKGTALLGKIYLKGNWRGNTDNSIEIAGYFKSEYP